MSNFSWSDRRSTIPQPLAWEANALPIELLSHLQRPTGDTPIQKRCELILDKVLTLALLVWWLGEYSFWFYRVLLVCVITIALASFRASLARTMC